MNASGENHGKWSLIHKSKVDGVKGRKAIIVTLGGEKWKYCFKKKYDFKKGNVGICEVYYCFKYRGKGSCKAKIRKCLETGLFFISNRRHSCVQKAIIPQTDYIEQHQPFQYPNTERYHRNFETDLNPIVLPNIPFFNAPPPPTFNMNEVTRKQFIRTSDENEEEEVMDTPILPLLPHEETTTSMIPNNFHILIPPPNDNILMNPMNPLFDEDILPPTNDMMFQDNMNLNSPLQQDQMMITNYNHHQIQQHEEDNYGSGLFWEEENNNEEVF